jgi:hypothetical protein
VSAAATARSRSARRAAAKAAWKRHRSTANSSR